MRESCPRCYERAVESRRVEGDAAWHTVIELNHQLFTSCAPNEPTPDLIPQVVTGIRTWLNLVADKDLHEANRLVGHMFTVCCMQAGRVEPHLVHLMLGHLDSFARALPLQRGDLEKTLRAALAPKEEPTPHPEDADEEDDEEDEPSSSRMKPGGFEWHCAPPVGSVVNWHKGGSNPARKVLIVGCAGGVSGRVCRTTGVYILELSTDRPPFRVLLPNLDPRSITAPREPYHMWALKGGKLDLEEGGTVTYHAKNGSVLTAVVEKLEFSMGYAHLKFRNGTRTRGLIARCHPGGQLAAETGNTRDVEMNDSLAERCDHLASC